MAAIFQPHSSLPDLLIFPVSIAILHTHPCCSRQSIVLKRATAPDSDIGLPDFGITHFGQEITLQMKFFIK
jgi:hypothetical protein